MSCHCRTWPRTLVFIGAGVLALLMPSLAPAQLIISLSFAGGTPPALPGGGNFGDIVRTAADAWQRVFSDPRETWNLHLTYGWEDQGLTSNGREVLLAQGGSPHRESQGAIWFNNNLAKVWFADPTPWNNSAYTQYTATNRDFGVGEVNVGRVFTGGVGPAAVGVDLLTVAAHEIGHALGLDTQNKAVNTFVPDGISLPVTAPRPFAGSTIILTRREHLDDLTALMYQFQDPGERKLISAADALANAQISQFSEHVNLDPYPVPEPCSLALMACGILGAAGSRWAKAALRRRQRA